MKTVLQQKMATDEKMINNKMTGRNKGEISRWFNLDALDSLERIADPGDLLEFDRCVYKHWGVYVGDGVVVHLEAENGSHSEKHSLKVSQQPLSKVLHNCKIRINNSLDQRTQLVSPATTIDEVHQRIKKFQNEMKPYDVIHRNCEHFANYCRYGATISSQSRLISITFLILCLDSLIFHRDLIAPISYSEKFNCSPTVPILRRVTECEIPLVEWGALLIYCLAGLRVVNILAAFCMTYGFVKNTLFSLRPEIRTCFLVFTILVAYFINPTDVSKIELGPYATSTGLAVCTFVFVLCCGFSHDILLNKLSLIFAAGLPIFVLGPKFVASLVLMMYIYEIIRLSQLDLTDSLDFLDFTMAFSYMLYAFGMVFPMLLLVTIIVDDAIRLKGAVCQKELNAIASVFLCVYLLSVFDWRHVIFLIMLCLLELYYTKIYLPIRGGSKKASYNWTFTGLTPSLCTYSWKCFKSDSWHSQPKCMPVQC